MWKNIFRNFIPNINTLFNGPYRQRYGFTENSMIYSKAP